MRFERILQNSIEIKVMLMNSSEFNRVLSIPLDFYGPRVDNYRRATGFNQEIDKLHQPQQVSKPETITDMWKLSDEGFEQLVHIIYNRVQVLSNRRPQRPLLKPLRMWFSAAQQHLHQQGMRGWRPRVAINPRGTGTARHSKCCGSWTVGSFFFKYSFGASPREDYC